MHNDLWAPIIRSWIHAMNDCWLLPTHCQSVRLLLLELALLYTHLMGCCRVWDWFRDPNHMSTWNSWHWQSSSLSVVRTWSIAFFNNLKHTCRPLPQTKESPPLILYLIWCVTVFWLYVDRWRRWCSCLRRRLRLLISMQIYGNRIASIFRVGVNSAAAVEYGHYRRLGGIDGLCEWRSNSIEQCNCRNK